MITIGIDYYPEQWDKSLWETDAADMERLGIKTARIGEFAWCRMEPREGEFDFKWLDEAVATLYRHGIKVILGTPTNCPPLWMFQKYPETLQCDREGNRVHPGIRGHRCMTNPTFRKFAARIVEKMAERYAGRDEIYAWQIDNELESNHCTCSSCADSFRQWLKNKYQTLDCLNQAWQTITWGQEVSDWSQITPLITESVNKTDWFNPAYMLDYERFCSWSVTDYVRFQCEIIHRYDSHAVITTNECFSSHMPDFHQLFNELDVASYDNYPPIALPKDPEEQYSNAFALDFIRSFKQKNFWIMEQLGGSMGCWQPITPALEPGMLEGYALQAVAHGADLLSFFRWRTSVGGAEMFCYGLKDHDNAWNKNLDELQHLVYSRLSQMPDITETTIHSKVAMLYSADQEFSFHMQAQSKGFAYWTQLRLFHDACMNLGVNLDILPEGASLAGYSVVIVPTHFVVDNDVVAALEEFVSNGGAAIITNRSGVKDKNGNCIFGESLPTKFSKLCGCHIIETDGIGEAQYRIRSIHGSVFKNTSWSDLIALDTAEPLARYMDRYYAGTPAVTLNEYGRGKAYYIGTVCEKAMYRSLLQDIFTEREIPFMEMLPDGVESTERSSNTNRYRFFFNNTLEQKSFKFNEQHIILQPMEVKILTHGGKWI